MLGFRSSPAILLVTGAIPGLLIGSLGGRPQAVGGMPYHVAVGILLVLSGWFIAAGRRQGICHCSPL